MVMTFGCTGPAGLPRFFTFILLGLALVGCGEPDDVTIAVAGTQGFLDAARLAVEDELQAGDLPHLDTVLVQEVSNRSDPAVRAAQELVETDGLIAVVGHANSVASLATSQVYNANEVVQIAPTSTTPLYSEAGPFSFRMVPPDPVQGEALARLVTDSLASARGGGPARLVVLYVGDDYGRGLRPAFADALPEAMPDGSPGPRLVLELPHTEDEVDEVDWNHQVTAVSEANPDAVVWLGRVPALDQLLPKLREELGEVPIYGGDALGPAAQNGDLHSDWDGVHFLDFVDMTATPELVDLGERLRDEEEGDDGVAWRGAGGPEALAYDAVRLLLASVRDGATTGPAMRDYLNELGRDRPPFEGIAGPVEFDEHGDMMREYVGERVVRAP